MVEGFCHLPGSTAALDITAGHVKPDAVPIDVIQRFRLGDCLVEATRLSIPCRHIEEILGKPVFDPLVHRSGLNCKILEGGTLRVGDAIRPL